MLSNFLTMLYRLPNDHPFALLAGLPGVVGLYNLVAAWQSFTKWKAKIEAEGSSVFSGAVNPVASTFKVDLEDYRPRRFYTICGAICLTVVFGLVAALSGPGAGTSIDMGAIYPAAGDGAGASRPPVKIAVAATAEERASLLLEQRRHGAAGLVFAGYGAYLYTLTLCISRLFSSALTGKFLTVSALRSAIALVLGFTAGATNLFGALGGGPALFGFFFVGLFPSWAMDALSRRAQEFFKERVVGVDFLPLRLIDGIDDGIVDRMSEIGLWDIQHMAAENPFALAARTLYPLRRVIDWIDQAILIGYVRQDIAHFRALGIRGAIDFAALFRDLMGIKYPISRQLGSKGRRRYRRALRVRAATLIDDLSKKTHLSRPCLEVIGRCLYEDEVVDFLWTQWFKPDRLEVASAVAPAQV